MPPTRAKLVNVPDWNNPLSTVTVKFRLKGKDHCCSIVVGHRSTFWQLIDDNNIKIADNYAMLNEWNKNPAEDVLPIGQRVPDRFINNSQPSRPEENDATAPRKKREKKPSPRIEAPTLPFPDLEPPVRAVRRHGLSDRQCEILAAITIALAFVGVVALCAGLFALACFVVGAAGAGSAAPQMAGSSSSGDSGE